MCKFCLDSGLDVVGAISRRSVTLGVEGVEPVPPRDRPTPSARVRPRAARTRASPDEPAERLRETVRAFLAAGRSATRQAALRHQNSVAYPRQRAEELLGRRVTESPIELTCALTLAAALGPVALSDGDLPADLVDG